VAPDRGTRRYLRALARRLWGGPVAPGPLCPVGAAGLKRTRYTLASPVQAPAAPRRRPTDQPRVRPFDQSASYPAPPRSRRPPHPTRLTGPLPPRPRRRPRYALPPPAPTRRHGGDDVCGEARTGLIRAVSRRKGRPPSHWAWGHPGTVRRHRPPCPRRDQREHGERRAIYRAPRALATPCGRIFGEGGGARGRTGRSCGLARMCCGHRRGVLCSPARGSCVAAVGFAIARRFAKASGSGGAAGQPIHVAAGKAPGRAVAGPRTAQVNGARRSRAGAARRAPAPRRGPLRGGREREQGGLCSRARLCWMKARA
jgi:hypothetical protein